MHACAGGPGGRETLTRFAGFHFGIDITAVHSRGSCIAKSKASAERSSSSSFHSESLSCRSLIFVGLTWPS